ncbi:phosphodiesterase [Marinospirillum alkaliphilum]|uniref:Diguanylate cyclase (GGDEF) domain-containing protein n=1 Tax=Marinospirillum alkaliphilum DSM 21637 TaxID=1122209 RepID=A0A1K1W4P7_9GAMM|nr:GGDEF domain-containing protein [Marinospirillum alkaliphilum]SFX32123.1 diguanylate cyclase (GGDEF) domain-containing protein [Marinospirillum alkaliphilum DSM 21637]
MDEPLLTRPDATSRQQGALQDILQQGRLLPLFQPVVSLREKCFYGWEALIRGPMESYLHHPLELFRCARQEGLLVALEQLSREKSLAAFARQQLPGKLFINASPDVLTEPDHEPGQTLELVQASGLEPGQLVIELTEQQPVHDFELMRRAINHYREMGFQIALDDLGNGYSGLRLWSELRPDYVKIDRHFVHQISHDRVKQDFLRFVLDMARSVGSTVIAEGVETQAEMQMLLDLGINLVQGYHFSRPQSHPAHQPPPALLDISPPEPLDNNEADLATSLLRKVRSISPDTSVAEAVEIFRQDEELFSLPVVTANDLPIGLLLRNQLMSTLLRPFGQELYYRKAVTCLMHEQPLIAEADQPLEAISQRITERSREHLDDDFIIARQGRYQGIGQVVDLLRIITELKVRSARQANPLTLLPGNGPIQDTLNAWLKRQDPLVVCYLDLDNFKVFNDTYGYVLGDELLKRLGTILQQYLHPHDDFIGHIGGDDFVAICRSKDWQERMLCVLHDFSRHSLEFYSEADRAAGGIHARDRFGVERFFSFVGVSIAALQAPTDAGITAHMLAAEVSHLKHFAKQLEGSSLVLQQGAQQRVLWPSESAPQDYQ